MASRRAILTGGLGLAALGLAGCSTGTPYQSNAGVVDAAVLPKHLPYDGVKADLPAEDGLCSAGFLRYPARPPKLWQQPPGDGRPVTAIVPTSFGAPPPLDVNPYWQELNRRVGSDLQLTTITAGADYDAKFATTMAGDQLPDMFFVGAVASKPQFMAARTVDLTDHLAGDRIAKYPALANLPLASWRECVFNGRLHALPISRGLVSLPSVLTRNDLLTGRGITSLPTDWAGIAALSKELTGGQTWAWSSAPLGYARGTLDIPNTVVESQGRLSWTLQDERQLQALEAVRRLVADGAVVPDSAATPTATRKLWFGAGRAILHPDSFIAWFSLLNANAKVAGIEIRALPIVGFNGGQGTQQVGSANVGISAINIEAADRVETLLRIADFLAAPFGTEEYLFQKFGTPGRNHNLNGDGDPVPTDRTDEINVMALYLCDAARVVYSAGHPDTARAAHAHQRAVMTKASTDPTVALHSDTAARKLTTLNRALNDVAAGIIAGRQPVTSWTGAVDTFLKGGGTEILAEYQAAFDKAPR